MVEQRVFPLKDGTQGVAYIPENGDVFTSRFDAVGKNTHPAIVKGKAVMIESFFLGVKDKDGKEITLTISKGQKKVLDKDKELNNKKIVFANYEHKTYGKQLGVKIVKE